MSSFWFSLEFNENTTTWYIVIALKTKWLYLIKPMRLKVRSIYCISIFGIASNLWGKNGTLNWSPFLPNGEQGDRVPQGLSQVISLEMNFNEKEGRLRPSKNENTVEHGKHSTPLLPFFKAESDSSSSILVRKLGFQAKL